LIPIHELAPFIFPIAAYPLIIAGLFGAEPALVMVVLLIILTSNGHSSSLELILYYGLGSLFGVLLPRQEQRITGFIWVGLSVAAAGAVVLTTNQLLEAEAEGLTLLTLFAVAMVNGMITAGFTVLMQSVLAPMLGQTTPLQLLELSRPDHPLLEYLLRNAPGTYQHSLQVANLAEQAAERIDANSLLTRVGALYHDIGKAKNAQFFVENQVYDDLNTHDNLDPIQSAGIIKDHVISGLLLAKEHKLPRRIQDFIAEHHGTFKTRYQWTQALNAVSGDASQLDEENFKYIGPRPQSRETALVMLADGCEARVRAKRPANEDEIRAIIKDTVDTCMSEGQLDDTPLTLKDLDRIIDSFTATLKGIHHPRVEYPTLDVPTQPTLKPLFELEAKAESPNEADETSSQGDLSND
jgi:putative nucleotidyltransferase with HDIG domain